MCERKFGQIPRGLRRTQDLPKKNRAPEEDNEMWMVALDAGFGVNSLVRDGRQLSCRESSLSGLRDDKIASHTAPRMGFYGMDDGMDGT